jgi:hypothetical protein
MKSHSELMSRVLERTKSEQDNLREMLQAEQSEALKNCASSLSRGLSSIENDIARRLQKYKTDLATLETLTSKWLWANGLNAFILFLLVMSSGLMLHLVREQWGLLQLQGQLGAVINSMRIDQGQVWVPVEGNQYYREKNGQLYMKVSIPKEK